MNSFISSSSLLVECLGFTIYSVCHLQIMTVLLLSNLDAFCCFFLMAVARTSSTMLNKSDESGHPCFVPNLEGNACSFCPLSIMLPVDLSYPAFIMTLMYVPSILPLPRLWVLDFMKCFFCVY